MERAVVGHQRIWVQIAVFEKTVPLRQNRELSAIFWSQEPSDFQYWCL